MSGLFATYSSVSHNRLTIISHSPRMISVFLLSQLSDLARLILGVSAVVFALESCAPKIVVLASVPRTPSTRLLPHAFGNITIWLSTESSFPREQCLAQTKTGFFMRIFGVLFA